MKDDHVNILDKTINKALSETGLYSAIFALYPKPDEIKSRMRAIRQCVIAKNLTGGPEAYKLWRELQEVRVVLRGENNE